MPDQQCQVCGDTRPVATWPRRLAATRACGACRACAHHAHTAQVRGRALDKVADVLMTTRALLAAQQQGTLDQHPELWTWLARDLHRLDQTAAEEARDA